jgi:hypothetical protein
MAKVEPVKLPQSDPQLDYRSQYRFDRGVVTSIDESNLPKNALKEANNIMLREDGAPGPRWGINWYGVAAPNAAEVDGGGMYESAAGAVHLLMVAGGNIYRSTDNGLTWDLCTGATLTVGHKCHIEQASQSSAGLNYAYITNGEDSIVRYDGTTALQVYSSLANPTGNTLSKTGLAGTTYTYRYRVVAVNAIGFTAASVALTVQVDRLRDRFDTSNFTTFAWNAVAGALRYDIYVGTAAGEEYYIDSVPGNSLSYTDQGTALENTNVLAPETNTTTGPKVGELISVGSRLWGTRDKDNPYRVWWTGSGPYIGYFATAYDGGYIDLQKGSQFRPVHIADYRDGKGTPFATVWCKSTDGRGCVWQIALESLTVADSTFTVPNAYKLPGSRGTNAPYSVVNVLNDYLFYNSQAVYNLGSRAQFLNLLSTDEISMNIRPDVEAVKASASDKVAAIYFKSRVFISVPYGADENNNTIVFDLDQGRKAWLPKAFTRGFERFFQYTDTAGEQHLLAWKPGDTRFSEISQDIQGDYSEAFETSLVTGLIHVNPKNRFEFMWVEEGEVEFSQPKGLINIELIGIERSRGFRSLGSARITPRTSNVGWSSFAWSTTPWSDTSIVPDTYSEASIKRYFDVQKELNAYQYRITTNSVDADYTLRTLQINGTPTQAGKPRQWRISMTT